MIDNKNIIITFSYYGVGGAQRRAVNLANEFVNKGYKVTILAVLGPDGTITPDNNYYNIDKRISLVSIPDYFEENKDKAVIRQLVQKCKKTIKWYKRLQYALRFFKVKSNGVNNSVRGIRNGQKLRAFLLDNQGAVIISFGFNIFESVYWASKGLNFRLIYAETNASDKYANDSNFEATVNLLKKADAWVFQTRQQMSFLGYDNNPRAVVIHNPIKKDLPDICADNRDKIIVNFCRLSQQKNLLLLLKAFRLFSLNNPDYKLKIYADIVNENNISLRNELLNYITENNLADKAFILPPTNDIHNVINGCSMFVSSSDYEGISNSMVEAMAMGLPCVCTDCRGGGAREMIRDGENGLLVPVGDADALATAMHRMANDNGLATNCGENAASVRKALAIEKIAEQWLEVINHI